VHISHEVHTQLANRSDIKEQVSGSVYDSGQELTVQISSHSGTDPSHEDLFGDLHIALVLGLPEEF